VQFGSSALASRTTVVAGRAGRSFAAILLTEDGGHANDPHHPLHEEWARTHCYQCRRGSTDLVLVPVGVERECFWRNRAAPASCVRWPHSRGDRFRQAWSGLSDRVAYMPSWNPDGRSRAVLERSARSARLCGIRRRPMCHCLPPHPARTPSVSSAVTPPRLGATPRGVALAADGAVQPQLRGAVGAPLAIERIMPVAQDESVRSGGAFPADERQSGRRVALNT